MIAVGICVCTVEYRCDMLQDMMSNRCIYYRVICFLCLPLFVVVPSLTPSHFPPCLLLLDLALATRQSHPGLARLIVDWLRRVCDDVMINNRVVLQQCSFGGGGILPFLVLLNTVNDGENHNHKRNDTVTAAAGGGGGGGTATTHTHCLQVGPATPMSVN